MNSIIDWCNENTGFLSAILSIVGILLSFIAICISIHTARLPYKKSLKLSSFYDVLFSKSISNMVSSQTIGLSINAVNTGKRNINITFLGLAVKDDSLGKGLKKMIKINEEMTGKGILSPTEIISMSYSTRDLLFNLTKLSNDAVVYVYASDSEGKEYFKKAGNAQNIIKSLSD